MQQKLATLGDKRLIVVTGKGGAGKSVLAAALATIFAQQKKVWLVEIGRKRDKGFSRLHELLGLNALRHSPQSVELGKSHFQASLLDPTQSLSEYVDLKLPTGGLAGMLLNNKVTASLLEVVPGLPELVSLGKLWHALTQAQEHRPDLVILDGPASGHAVTLLRTPANFEKLTKTGPLYRDAKAMREFMEDEKQCAVVFATLPEEMSLQESIEHRALLKKLSQPLLVVNKVFPSPGPQKKEGPADLLRAYEYSYERAARERSALHAFQKEKWPSIEVPFLFPEPKAAPLSLRMAEALVEAP